MDKRVGVPPASTDLLKYSFLTSKINKNHVLQGFLVQIENIQIDISAITHKRKPHNITRFQDRHCLTIIP